MNNWLTCKTFEIDPYKRGGVSKRLSLPILLIDKTKVRTRTIRLRVKERNGQPSDQVVNTPNGGAINIQLFDDYSQVDQLLIENASGGNGRGIDPNNSNTGNDLFASPIGPDGPATSPPILNTSVPVASNQTRVRVLPNVNNSNSTTIYDARISYTWRESRTKHREYLLGFIPLFGKFKKGNWRPTPLNNNGSTRRRWK